MPQILSWASLALVTIFHVTHALRQEVLSSFIYTRHGDRTPLYSPEMSYLTPFGAQQMNSLGSTFRQRYLTASFNAGQDSTLIRDMSHYLLDSSEVSILTTDHQFTTASAQAFMQGLYPPIANNPNLNFTYVAGVSNLANGTNIIAPLNGYQYPEINSASSYDLNSIWVDGAANCPAYTAKILEYYNSSDFKFLNQTTWEFYQSLEEEYLQNTFFQDTFGYSDSYFMYDYLQYEYLHNTTFRRMISNVNMTRAKVAASDWVYALFSNATDPVKSIAGRTLSNIVLNSFYNTIQWQGRTNKLNLLFGDFEPMVSFAALAGLTSNQNAIFYNIPPMASSFVFELVALRADNDPGTSFPDDSDLFVQFFFQNGTDADSRLTAYPLFGSGPSQTLIPYSEFVAGLSRFTLNGVREWCQICGSYGIFCSAFTSNNKNNPSLGGSKRGSALSPAIAGVVGAVVALAVAGILFGLLMLFAGFRVRREQRGKRKSDLAGFKGSQKLASDQDLTLPKGGAAVNVTEPETAKGHERVGSWELRQKAKREEAGQMGAVNLNKPRRPSYEDDEIQIDPYAPAVKPHDHV